MTNWYANPDEQNLPLVTFDKRSLHKNCVVEDEVRQVFQSELSFPVELGPSLRGNDRAMVIGWTHVGRILEIGIEYFEDEDREHVFHAMDAGKGYRKQFEERLGYGG